MSTADKQVSGARMYQILAEDCTFLTIKVKLGKRLLFFHEMNMAKFGSVLDEQLIDCDVNNVNYTCSVLPKDNTVVLERFL